MVLTHIYGISKEIHGGNIQCLSKPEACDPSN